MDSGNNAEDVENTYVIDLIIMYSDRALKSFFQMP